MSFSNFGITAASLLTVVIAVTVCAEAIHQLTVLA